MKRPVQFVYYTERRLIPKGDHEMIMLDIETTGLDKEKDDVIQIAALKLVKNEDGLFIPGEFFVQVLPTIRPPADVLKDDPVYGELYAKARELGNFGDANAPTVRAALTGFLGQKALLMGVNVLTFDLRFLEKKGFLLESDYHYQVSDITGVIEYVLRVLQLPPDRKTRDRIKANAKELGRRVHPMPPGGPHDGLWDCYDQTCEMNGYILAGRGDLRMLDKACP